VSASSDDDAHLSLDALADLDEGLSADAERAQSEHVEGCPTCQRRRARLRETRALLSTLPPEPMPSDVGDRIDAALAAAPPLASIMPTLPRTRRWRTKPTLAGLSAAAAVAALVAALVVGVAHKGANNNPGAGSEAAAGAARPQVVIAQTSGSVYTPANVVTKVQRAITDAKAARFFGTATPSPADGLAQPNTAQARGTVPRPLARLHNSAGAFLNCLLSLTDGKAIQPLLVDYARWHARPAVIVVLPGFTPGKDDVWVLGGGCSPANADVIYYTSFRPTSP
jgi:hypothetical protein